MNCSISTALFDGYPLDVAFSEIADAGGTHAEPAFIQGYTDPFTEEIFNAQHARDIRRQLADAGLGALAVSCHMDLGVPGAVDVFCRRMEFVKTIGAGIIVTNAALREHRSAFMNAIEELSRFAAEIDLSIALENPGDGRPNLLDRAQDALDMLGELQLPRVGLNYDPGNTVSHLPGRLDPIEDAMIAFPVAMFMHIKDVMRRGDGYYFAGVGQGDLDYAPLLKALARERPELPYSIEIPARLHRDLESQPVRAAEPVPLEKLCPLLRSSIDFVRSHTGR
jgi:sugar phosphate isomerase/epimerase